MDDEKKDTRKAPEMGDTDQGNDEESEVPTSTVPGRAGDGDH